MARIGLLGGTFDPPHLGHLVVAETVRDALGLDRVDLVVAGRPWMKDGESHADRRVAMARLAVADDPGLGVDDREAHRDGLTYTFDTLTELTEANPDVEYTFVLGTDVAATLPQWHRAGEAVALATWAVVGRPGTAWPTHELADHLTPVEVPQIGVSSTMLRAQVAAGRSVRYLVPGPVVAYIDRHRLYRPPDA